MCNGVCRPRFDEPSHPTDALLDDGDKVQWSVNTAADGVVVGIVDENRSPSLVGISGKHVVAPIAHIHHDRRHDTDDRTAIGRFDEILPLIYPFSCVRHLKR